MSVATQLKLAINAYYMANNVNYTKICGKMHLLSNY